MKSKKQVIEEAYGPFYGLLEDLIDENGWIQNPSPLEKNKSLYHKFEALKESIGLYKDTTLCIIRYRPHSLKNLENNNGWIGINHRSEMPKEKCMIKICIAGKPAAAIYQWEPKTGLMYALEDIMRSSYTYRFYDPKTSHYKIVEPDKDPIY